MSYKKFFKKEMRLRWWQRGLLIGFGMAFIIGIIWQFLLFPIWSSGGDVVNVLMPGLVFFVLDLPVLLFYFIIGSFLGPTLSFSSNVEILLIHFISWIFSSLFYAYIFRLLTKHFRKKKNKTQLGFTLPIVILMAIVLIAAGGIGYYFYKASQEGEKETSVPEEQVNFTKDKIFFVTNLFKDRNLYMTNKFGEDKEQLTSYPRQVGNEILPFLNNAQVISDKYLGYYRCDVMVGDYNCGVYRANIDLKTPEELITTDKGMLIEKLAFADRNTFAYSVRFYEEVGGVTDYYGRIYLYKDGQTKIIGKVDYGKDEAGIEVSCSELLFSPDGTKILFASGFKSWTESIHIFDIDSNQLAKIEVARNAAWMDDETIVFLRPISHSIYYEQGFYSSEAVPKPGIYSFDIVSKEESKYCTIEKKVINPKFSIDFQKVVYCTWDWEKEDDKGNLWLLDLESCESEKLSDNSSSPLWISEKEILVSNNKEIGELGEPHAISMLVFDIFTKEKYRLFNIEEMGTGWYIFISPLINGGNQSIFFSQESQ